MSKVDTASRAAAPTSDDIEELIGLYKSGCWQDTETKARQLAQDYPDAFFPWNVLGLALAEQEKFEEAVSYYRQALKIKPDFAEAHNNLGVALKDLGRPDDAGNCYRQALTIKPDLIQAHTNLALLFRESGKLDDAVACYRQVLKLNPNLAMAHNNLGLMFKELGKRDDEVASFRRALEVEPGFADAHNNLGNYFLRLHEFDEAIASFRLALKFNPNFAEAYNNLGLVFRELGRLQDAVASYRQALRIKPNFAAAHSNLGAVYTQQGRVEDAVSSIRRAIAIKADFAEAHYHLTEVLEKNNRIDALREAVNEAKRCCPDHPSHALPEARLLKRDRDYAAARTVLESVAEPGPNAEFMAARAHLLGDLCDRLDDADAAFKYFSEGNLRHRDHPLAKRSDGNSFLARIDALTERFTADWAADWQPLASADDRRDPVFIVGFPRSGTTLLDTILRSHAGIEVVEEMPLVRKVRSVLGRLPGGDPGGLAQLDPAGLSELRGAYFTELDKYIAPNVHADVVIDKLPLNAVDAGLIQRVFPQAKFLFAQRHPCDCVLSCFMQNFQSNDAMVNFFDLEDAARFYDKVMTLWQQYQAVLSLQVHTVRYETLIENFEETIAPVLDFLGLDWDDGVRDYIETAKRRGRINTPSYNQVTQPLYTRARGRWERYRKHMQPVLPILLPWAERFGYDSSA